MTLLFFCYLLWRYVLPVNKKTATVVAFFAVYLVSSVVDELAFRGKIPILVDYLVKLF